MLTASQPRANDRQHITQKPVEILADLVQICPPGGTVLDPFTGAGSTGVAAVTTGRSFIGIEITTHYSQVASARIRHAIRGTGQHPRDMAEGLDRPPAAM